MAIIQDGQQHVNVKIDWLLMQVSIQDEKEITAIFWMFGYGFHSR